MASSNAVLLLLLLPLFALYSSGIAENNVTVTCDDYNMTVSLEKERFPYLNASMLHLRYSWCSATESSTHLFLSTSLNDCGTTYTETEESIIFSNEIQGDHYIVQNTITRNHDFDLQFNCSYSRRKRLALSYTPDGIVIPPPIEGFGNLIFKLDFYKSSSFATPYGANEYPLTFDLGEYLYMKFSVESNADLVVLAVNCKATKDGNYYSQPSYDIIDNGCSRDTTMVYQYDSSRSFQQVWIKAFRFFNDYDPVYFHFELLACYRNAPNSRCSQSCVNSRRRKRGVTTREDSEELPPTTTKTYNIRRGPVKFAEIQEAGETGKNKQQAALIGGATAAGGVGLLAIIGLVVLFVKYRIARLMMNRNKVGDLYTTQDDQLSRRNAYVQEDDMIEKSDSM